MNWGDFFRFRRNEYTEELDKYLLNVKKVYTEFVNFKIETDLDKSTKNELKHALDGFNSASAVLIKDFLNNLKINKSFEALFVATANLEVLDKILDFEQNEGNFSIQMKKLTEDMAMILRLSGERHNHYNEFKSRLNLKDKFLEENLDIWGLADFLNNLKMQILKGKINPKETDSLQIGDNYINKSSQVYSLIIKFTVLYNKIYQGIDPKLKKVFFAIAAKQIQEFLGKKPTSLETDLVKTIFGIYSRDSEKQETLSNVKIELEYDKKNFYFIDREFIIKNTTQTYRDFLKDAGYGDLDSCSGILIGKKISKTNINWYDAIKYTNERNCKLLTTCLMYKIFIPWIKDQASKVDIEGYLKVQHGNAQKTLNEIDTKAEWLADYIINKNIINIDMKTKILTLPQIEGKFDRTDLNEFGYPNQVKNKGEFYYWYPRTDEVAVVRSRYSELGLFCDGTPSDSGDGVGVRLAKFLP